MQANKKCSNALKIPGRPWGGVCYGLDWIQRIRRVFGEWSWETKIPLVFKQIKKDRIRFLYSVQGNGSWERAVR